jgi:hypothetical protein
MGVRLTITVLAAIAEFGARRQRGERMGSTTLPSKSPMPKPASVTTLPASPQGPSLFLLDIDCFPGNDGLSSFLIWNS